MTTPLHQRREQLRQMYGFDFPEDLFRFWEFAQRLRPLEPLHALSDSPLSMLLVGPFEVLAGRFDGRPPPLSILLHWRYYLDPPEFFTVLAGADGLHWGYYLDDPDSGTGCIASYYTNDAFELSTDGDTLFAAVRLSLEEQEAQAREDHGYGLLTDDDLEHDLAALAELRQLLIQFATGKHAETGAAYVDRHAGRSARNERIVAPTQEGMGIVVPPETYRPLPWPDQRLRKYLWKTEDPIDVVEEARQALREGFPGTALELGKELWCLPGERRARYAFELLDAAYAALGRESLRQVLHVHHNNRDLPSVDLLELADGSDPPC